MGLSQQTSRLAYLLYAASMAPMTYTIILLRSLGDLDGGFDTPKEKCPLHRGSSDWVTDSLASMTPPSSSPCSPPIARVQRTNSCATPVNVSPWQIPRKMQSLCDLPTPPLTPDDDAGSTPCSLAGRQSNDALDLLLNIFPRNGVGLLSYAKSVCLSAPDLGVSFDGIMLESPGEPKTLYIDGKNASAVGFRESIVALLDLAVDQLQCSALVIALDNSSQGFGNLLHSLMYVGGTVVTKPRFPINPAYTLVGLEI